MYGREEKGLPAYEAVANDIARLVRAVLGNGGGESFTCLLSAYLEC